MFLSFLPFICKNILRLFVLRSSGHFGFSSQILPKYGRGFLQLLTIWFVDIVLCPKQACAHGGSLAIVDIVTSGANLYPTGGCRVIFLWRCVCLVFVSF